MASRGGVLHHRSRFDPLAAQLLRRPCRLRSSRRSGHLARAKKFIFDDFTTVQLTEFINAFYSF